MIVPLIISYMAIITNIMFMNKHIFDFAVLNFVFLYKARPEIQKRNKNGLISALTEIEIGMKY